MKKVKRIVMAALLAGMCSFGYAQDYFKAPKPNEKVIGTVSWESPWIYSGTHELRCYSALLNVAKKDYPNNVVDIREMTIQCTKSSGEQSIYQVVGKVVDLHDPEAQTYESLSQALNKALRNVREGSRMAIDQVTVISGMDRETLKDQLLDVLLDKGYRVVAKDYLEKLYEEQEAQQSGIYNDKTTVQENNFSAVGYYINVKVTDTSLRVQVVNVSTGEYEGNATVNF